MSSPEVQNSTPPSLLPAHLMMQHDTSKDMAKVAQLSMLNSVSSPLLRLPGELRNTIYGYVLGGHTFGETWENKKLPPHILASLLVCRQIYSEARMLVFELNTFVHKRYNTYAEPKNFSLTRLSSEQMSHITSVRLHLDDFGLAFEFRPRTPPRLYARVDLRILRELSPRCTKIEISTSDWCGSYCRVARISSTGLSDSVHLLQARIHDLVPAADTPVVWFPDAPQHVCRPIAIQVYEAT